MKKVRPVIKVIRNHPVVEGAGVHLHRVFGFGETHLFDPFLLLDDFRSDKPGKYLPGFPWHPHRGIETITYMLEGSVEHGDSMGNSGVIKAGDVQWMTAGSGIIHQEMPKGDGQLRMGGFQLWTNLPSTHKMMAPRYREVKSHEIPGVTPAEGVHLRLIAGTVGDIHGPVQDIVTEPEYFDITMTEGATFMHDIREDRTAFAYCIEGSAIFGKTDTDTGAGAPGVSSGDSIGNGTLALFGEGNRITITSIKEHVRFLLFSGKPIREPVAWYGPIVMNTQEELDTAFKEYENGTFVKNNAEQLPTHRI